MKGIIFNLFEEFITKTLGEDAYDSIASECRLITQEPFIGPGTYPDEDLVALITKAAEKMRQDVPTLIRRFGRYLFPRFVAKFPNFVAPFSHPRDFLRTVDWIHFTELKKLYEDATPPHFSFNEPSEDRLIMIYRSERKLCHLIEGLLEGVSDHFKTPVQFNQTRCMHHGDNECEFQISFPAKR